MTKGLSPASTWNQDAAGIQPRYRSAASLLSSRSQKLATMKQWFKLAVECPASQYRWEGGNDSLNILVLALSLDQPPGEWNYRRHPSGQWLADGKQSNSVWFHTPSKNYSCTNKTRNLCDTLAVVLVLSIQYGDSMQARAGSSSSLAKICPSIAKQQKQSQVSKQCFNDLGFLNSI